MTGLKCLSGKSGRKRVLLRYVVRGRKRSIALGRFPDIDVNAPVKRLNITEECWRRGEIPRKNKTC